MSATPSTPDDTYTHGHHDAVLRSHRSRTAQNSAAYLVPHLSAGQRLLDVGCGPGTITADLAGLVAPGHVVAIDRADDVLAEATAACERAGVDNVTVETGDVYALAYPDDSFDVVHAHQVLQHLSDPVGALAEMARVCRPGGLVAVRDADYAAMTWYPADPALDRWLEVYHAVARGNDAEPDAGRRLLAWANEAGLTDVVASASVWCFADDASRAWWGGLWAERLQTSALGEQAVAGGHASTDELATIAAGFDRWKSSPDAWFAVLNGEILGRA